MKFKKLSIDFSDIKINVDFHNKIKELFGFPDFYGMNFNALNDCLSSLRYPEEGMSHIHLDKDECLLLEVKKIDLISDELRCNFLLSIKKLIKAQFHLMIIHWYIYYLINFFKINWGD